MGGAAAQRRVLAFLSALAVAGDGGLSRDRIAALLWPDADTDRARHSVTQALYAARRALRADDLFEAGSDIRLNRTVLTSDVQEFQSALEAGELERAVALYQGPFLDGFFLSGSPEFEQWSSAQRARLEDAVVRALAELASRAEDAQNFRAAVEWRKRLAVLRPLDSASPRTSCECSPLRATAPVRSGTPRYTPSCCAKRGHRARRGVARWPLASASRRPCRSSAPMRHRPPSERLLRRSYGSRPSNPRRVP